MKRAIFCFVRAASIAVALTVLQPLIAHADITGILGDITEIAPPPSVQENALVSTTTMSVFAERTNYILPAELSVDILGVGRGDNDPITPMPISGSINAGTRVDIYLVHFDRPGDTFGVLFGSLGFDAEVLGVIHTDSRLDDSDFLGAPGTSYPGGLSQRGLGQTIEQFDWVEVVNPVMGPPLSVRVNSAVDFVLDQVRIITVSSDSVPEPTTIWLAISGMIGTLCTRRRQS